MGRESPIRMSQISTQTAGNWERVEIPDNVKGKKIQKEEYKENLMHIIKFFAYKEGVLKKKSSLKLYGDIFHQGLNI